MKIIVSSLLNIIYTIKYFPRALIIINHIRKKGINLSYIINLLNKKQFDIENDKKKLRDMDPSTSIDTSLNEKRE